MAQGNAHWQDPCKHSNEPLGFIKGREFCDQLSDY